MQQPLHHARAQEPILSRVPDSHVLGHLLPRLVERRDGAMALPAEKLRQREPGPEKPVLRPLLDRLPIARLGLRERLREVGLGLVAVVVEVVLGVRVGASPDPGFPLTRTASYRDSAKA